MKRLIEERPDNCPDQPRFDGGPILVALAVVLFWGAAIAIVVFCT